MRVTGRGEGSEAVKDGSQNGRERKVVERGRKGWREKDEAVGKIT